MVSSFPQGRSSYEAGKGYRKAEPKTLLHGVSYSFILSLLFFLNVYMKPLSEVTFRHWARHHHYAYLP